MSIKPVPGWPHAQSPFHEGEISIQTKLGIADRMDRQGRSAIRALMPDQHRAFFAQLPFVVVGSTDRDGQPWASILVGRPGFLHAPDAAHLAVKAVPLFGSPLEKTLVEGGQLGMLGIELHTRRRNRVNGIVEGLGRDGFTLQVHQSFGNCPQYIQHRDTTLSDAIDEPGLHRPVHRSDHLDARARSMIAGADTFFIASGFQGNSEHQPMQRGADVSHRGGKPGFVRVDDGHTLTIPDFVGNFFFNTLGNLLLDPRAGLLFVDFTSGDVLYLSGQVEIIWDGDELKNFAGAERLMRFRVAESILVQRSIPLSWSPPQASPILGRTGSWGDAARAIAAGKIGNSFRRFVIKNTSDESATIRSLYLEPADGGGVAFHEPGQFLPVRIQTGGASDPILRTYTISDASNGTGYRLSIKREASGTASNWLHAAQVGSELEALAPRGKFTFDIGSNRPVVMLSAGVGVTPMIAMLNAILVNDGRSRYPNRIIFIHGARNSREHAFADHVRMLASRHANLSTHIAYSNPLVGDVLGKSHDSIGRLDMALLKTLLPPDDYDVYLCGPAGFMAALSEGMLVANFPSARLRSETFGPASAPLPRRPAIASGKPISDKDDEPVAVIFSKSGVTAMWRSSSGTLLELAESIGLSPAFSCRAGICGTCATRVINGEVTYGEAPMANINVDEVLICCSTPRPGPHADDAALRSGVTLDL